MAGNRGAHPGEFFEHLAGYEPILGGRSDFMRDAAAYRPPDDHLAAAWGPFAELSARVQHVVVGGDQAGDHGLAKSCAGIYHDLLAVAGDRVGGEHDPGGLGLDHALHDDGDAYLARVDPAPAPIGDGSIGPEGAPAAAHCVEQRFLADDV